MFLRSIALFLSTGLACATTFPALTYSTYVREHFTPNATATDAAGNIYLAGNVTLDPASSLTTVLVIKLDPTASTYLYVRYLGGSASDSAAAIAVDSSGNAYVAGAATSPDFPVTGGPSLGTAPSTSTERSFVAKLNPNGQLVFSDFLGGSTNSYAQGVAVNAAGQVLVTGLSVAAGFPSTPGAYSVSNTAFAPFLLELDPAGSKIVFSTTGIGGNAIALDAAGNIYVAGTTGSLTYPTTAGTYQPTFPVFQTCIAPCTGSFQGPNQYVSKLDPTGTTLIFSTAVSGTGNTLNRGVAVDSAGNVYLTGLAGAGYPYTVTPPSIPQSPAIAALATPALPFLTKLDPAGQKLLYSVPVGGLGVQADSNGNAYAAGLLGLISGYYVTGTIPALSNLPSSCLVPQATRGASAYAASVDSSGNVLGSQFLGGSNLVISGVALSGGTLWLIGATALPDFPMSPNTLTDSFLSPGAVPGGYLGAVNFAATRIAAGGPQIGCIVDSADLEPAGPIAPYQLLTIFGSNLGPTTPVTATGNTTTSLGGVSVTFGNLSAVLLYVSANQINLAVPSISYISSGSPMQVTFNSQSSLPLEFAIASANPSLFVIPGSYQTNSEEFFALALNADGSQNSSTNPAQAGSVISVFVNGLSPDPQLISAPAVLYTGGGVTVLDQSQLTPFVLKVDLQLPTSSATFNCQPPNTSLCTASFKIFDLPSYLNGQLPGSIGGLSVLGMVYVAP